MEEQKDIAVIRQERAQAKKDTIADCCNKWLRKSKCTKRFLYDKCLVDGALDADMYAQFDRTLQELQNDNKVDGSRIYKKKKRSKHGVGGHKELSYKEMIKIAEIIKDKGDVITGIQTALGYFQGLRNLSICSIKANFIDFEKKEMFVQAIKDSPPGWISLTEPAEKLLRMYFDYAGIKENSGTYLFPSPYCSNGHIKPKAYYERFRKVLEQADLHGENKSFYTYTEKKGYNAGVVKRKYWHSVHSLRHSAGCALLETSDGDLNLVQHFLLHKSPETTAQIYAKRRLKSMRIKITSAMRGQIKRTQSGELHLEEKKAILRQTLEQLRNQQSRKNTNLKNLQK